MTANETYANKFLPVPRKNLKYHLVWNSGFSSCASEGVQAFNWVDWNKKYEM